MQSIVVRLSVQTPEGAVSPHPAYGSQLQTQGVLGKVPPEGRAYLRWTHTTFRYPDGRNVALRSPRVVFGELAHGPLGDGALASARLAPAIASIGLLESIPAAALIEHEAAGRTRGRLHRIVDHDTDETAIGRFGWKATQPTLPEQVTLAFLEDLGVTSGRHPADNCPELQRACLESPTAPYPELDADRLDALIAHLRSIAPPPARSDRAGRGARMFAATGCGKCHVPTWPVDPHPDRPDITQVHPYTDMMLHDMGPALSDGRPDGIATGAEWRTAPLWGIGRSRTANGNAFFLHDGRARSIEEAILWHSGEGAGARRRFVRLRRPDREALLRFIDGL